MSSRNNVTLVGRLVRENELKEVGDSQNLRNALAVDRNYKNSDGDVDTDFINIVAWNGVAGAISKYTEKGNRISVSGEIRTSKVEKNGKTFYNTEVRVNDVGFIDFAEDTGNNSKKKSQKNKSKDEGQVKENTNDEEEVDKVLDEMEDDFDVPF